MPSTAQPAPETDEKKSRGLRSYVMWALVAVMVYVLSIGPVALMQEKGVFGATAMNILDVIYQPIRLAHNHTFLQKPIGMYLHLWLPKKFDSQGNITGEVE